uniref:Enolase 4 n=1 Tax=Seriola lalandi dorsalis TaxID=1841481 RepID=A0A3B4Y3T4_SERLL
MSYQAVTSRVSEEEQDFYEIKNAAEFYRVNRVPEQIEGALNELFLHKPRDVHGYLANYFANLSAPPRINRLRGKEVYDTRGQLSIEVEVFCIVSAISSLFGSKESSLDWRAESQERADHVMTAVQWINEPLNNMLKGQNPCDQSEVDHALRYDGVVIHFAWSPISVCRCCLFPCVMCLFTGKKSNTSEKPFPPAEPPEPVLPGSLAIGSVSVAVARTGAQLQGLPLYGYIAALKNGETPTQFYIPVSLVTLLSCGKKSAGKLSLLEEIILIPKAGQRVKQVLTTPTHISATLHDSGAPAVSYERPEQPLDLIVEACINLGLALGTEIHLALNCDARELMDFSKGKYEVSTGVLKSPDELVDMYQTLVSKYPAVVALINPFRREVSSKRHRSFLNISNIALPHLGVRGHILKHTDEMTISDLVRITSEHQGNRSTEIFLSHSLPLLPQAVGLGLDYVKLGGLSGAERMTKYNRLISIEEELAQQGILGGFFIQPLINENMQTQTEAGRTAAAQRRLPGRQLLCLGK